jgi:hypothetical protein
MYVNAKTIPVETVLGIRGGVWGREVEGGNLSMIHLIHCKNFYNFYNVPTPSTTTEKFF